MAHPMMHYESTRGGVPSFGPVEATLSGILRDNGLAMPKSIPKITVEGLGRLSMMDRRELQARVMWPYFASDSIEFGDFQRLINESYGDQWDDPRIAPVVPLGDNRFMLELFHGPTLSFKDQALQPLGYIQPFLLNQRKESIVIVTATSGDTGPAAIEAFANKQNVEIFVLFPKNGTSAFQRRQMTTVTAPNVHVIEIAGTFDDCQDIVKELRRPSVNSINWFRIAAQIPYYFSAALEVMKLTGSTTVSFAVPTGNFGNILAGIFAKLMGLPIARLIGASNENNMLVDFIMNGVYRPREVIPTNSPSVDIGKSSNVERLVKLIVKQPTIVRMLYEQDLKEEGQFSIDPSGMRRLGLEADWIGTETRTRVMRRVFNDYEYVLDTHSANAYGVGVLRQGPEPLIVHATASPAKFEDAIQQAIGRKPDIPLRFADIGKRPERGAMIANSAPSVASYIQTVLNERKAA